VSPRIRFAGNPKFIQPAEAGFVCVAANSIRRESKIYSTRGGGFRLCRREFDSPGILNLPRIRFARNLNRPQFQALFYPSLSLFLTIHGQLELVLAEKFC